MFTSRTVALALVLAVVGCSKSETKQPGAASGSATAGSGATATAPVVEPKSKPAATDGEPSGEVFHAGDKNLLDTFDSRDLAVGGGWVYWIEKPRIDKNGLDKNVLRRKATSGAAAPEAVTEPGKLRGIAADADNVYTVGKAVHARPHAGGEWRELAKGFWFEVVPGDKFLMLRSDQELALVSKQGGAVESVWKGKGGSHTVRAEGDRFYVMDLTGASKKPTRTITVYEPGKPAAVIVDHAQVFGELRVHGDHLYFPGPADATKPLMPGLPLWRVNKMTGGTPEAVGDRALGFGSFLLRNNTLYGMVITREWKLRKLPLEGGTPVLLDNLPGFSGMVTALAADDTHLYYLTRVDVNRVAL